jgi:hypothetical protein
MKVWLAERGAAWAEPTRGRLRQVRHLPSNDRAWLLLRRVLLGVALATVWVGVLGFAMVPEMMVEPLGWSPWGLLVGLVALLDAVRHLGLPYRPERFARTRFRTLITKVVIAGGLAMVLGLPPLLVAGAFLLTALLQATTDLLAMRILAAPTMDLPADPPLTKRGVLLGMMLPFWLIYVLVIVFKLVWQAGGQWSDDLLWSLLPWLAFGAACTLLAGWRVFGRSNADQDV